MFVFGVTAADDIQCPEPANLPDLLDPGVQLLVQGVLEAQGQALQDRILLAQPGANHKGETEFGPIPGYRIIDQERKKKTTLLPKA